MEGVTQLLYVLAVKRYIKQESSQSKKANQLNVNRAQQGLDQQSMDNLAQDYFSAGLT
jgi:hypothetical protein